MKKLKRYKIFLFTILSILVINVNSYAEINYINERNDEIPDGLTQIYYDYYIFEYEGTQYYINKDKGSIPKKYIEKEFNKFIIELGASGYVKTDSGYMVWKNPKSYSEIFVAGDSWKGFTGFFVWFYDNDFNLIHEEEWGSYILGCSYINGSYVCELISGTIGYLRFVSNNMVDWDTSERDYKNDIRSCGEIIYRSNEQYNNIVSFDGGKSFTDVIYEDENCNTSAYRVDMSLIVKNSGDCFYISKDNIYSIVIPYQIINAFDGKIGSHVPTI